MNNHLSIILAIILLSATSCEDECRYVEPATGNPWIELVLLDSNSVNVFDHQFDIHTAKLTLESTEIVSFDIDSTINSIGFWFDNNYGHMQDHTDSYTLELDSIAIEFFNISYHSSETGACGSWRYDYVHVTHDDIIYVRPDNGELLEIVL